VLSAACGYQKPCKSFNVFSNADHPNWHPRPSAVHRQANAVYEAVFLRQKRNGGDVDNITLPSLPRPAVCDPKIFLTDPVIFPICA
jgi:hypothetical protein